VKTNETERLERELEASFAVPVPPLEFDPGAASTLSAPVHRARAWKFGAVGAVAAAVLAAVVVFPGIGASGPKSANAAELIERSIAATDALAANPSNYHMIAVIRSSETETTVESWVGGQNRYRVESRSRVNGVTYLDGTAMSAEEMWIYHGPEDAPVIAHGPRLISVLPAPGSVSLAQHLEGWNADGCFKAQLAGTERVAGREAHVISVTPTPETCLHPGKPLKNATIWVDVKTDIALKMVYEGDTGELVSSFEVTLFETFESLPDSAFSYAPHEDAEVIEFTSAADLKQALAPAYIAPRGSHVIIEHDWRSDPVKNPANEGSR
jgi:outer membrane lipoprotein-sorting protein